MFLCGFTFGKLSECDIKTRAHNTFASNVERTRLIGEMVVGLAIIAWQSKTMNKKRDTGIESYYVTNYLNGHCVGNSNLEWVTINEGKNWKLLFSFALT